MHRLIKSFLNWYNYKPEVKMKQFIQEVVQAYKGDPSAASIVISLIPNGMFYGSIVRYTERYGKGKEVVYSSQYPTLSGMLTSLYNGWTGHTETRRITAPGELSEREMKLFMKLSQSMEPTSEVMLENLLNLNTIVLEGAFTEEEVRLIEDFFK